MSRFGAVLASIVLVVLGPVEAPAQQVTAQDLDKVLEKADALLEEAKSAYEAARDKASGSGFVDAGFKLEEARIKFIVLQEIGSPEKQKIAGDRLRAVNQLAKLIHDGKVAVSGSPAGPAAEKLPSPDSPPAPASPETPVAKPAVPPPAVDVTKRLAVPGAAAQRDAEKLIKDLYKEQYSKKSPADRKKLARDLLDQASKTRDDAAALWILYREAQEVAAQGAEAKLATEAVDAAAQTFDVDAMALKTTVLGTAGKAAKTPEEFAAVAEALLRLTDDQVAADQFDGAEKSSSAALQFARKTTDASLLPRATIRSKEVAEAKGLYRSMKSVLEAIAKNPDDPAANLEMGQFLCFVKGSWDLGSRFLVKGSDPSLKALAEKEDAGFGDSSGRIAVADGWWDLSEKEKSSLRKTQLVAHARALYEAALPDAPSLQRVKIERRLDAAEQLSPSAGPVDVLRLVDPNRDAVKGVWTLEGRALSSGAGVEFARISVPYLPPEEYDLTVMVERLSGEDSFYIGLASGNSQWFVAFDGWISTTNGIGLINGRNTDVNETRVKTSQVLKTHKPSSVVCSVRKDGTTVMVDGKKLIVYKGSVDHLSNADFLRMPNPRTLWLGANWCAFSVSKLVLTPVSGQGKKLY